MQLILTEQDMQHTKLWLCMYSFSLHFCYLYKLTICFLYSDQSIHLVLFVDYEFICKAMGISGARVLWTKFYKYGTN